MIRKLGCILMLLILVGCTGKPTTPDSAKPVEQSTPQPPVQGKTPPSEELLTNPLPQLMELNRSGQWTKAAKAAQQWLDGAGKYASVGKRCEAVSYLMYANSRLRRGQMVQSNVRLFDTMCETLPKDSWVRTEVNKLRPGTATAHEDGFWQVVDAASVGMDTGALAEHQIVCETTRADACLVIYKDRIVQEWYSDVYALPAHAMSSTKSVSSLLVGMLIEDGKIKSMDEPVCTYIQEWCEGLSAKVTLRHLLTMTSGLTHMAAGVGGEADKNPYVIGLSPGSEPGTVWDYSNEGAQLLSPIMDKAAGEPIQDYARRRLFEPLGMLDTQLHVDEAGHAWTYADMDTSARDFARLGVLMLHRGMWKDKRIISEDWVSQSTRRYQTGWQGQGYGLMWWLYDDKPEGFAALGFLDTNLYVFPKLDLVVVRMQAAMVNGLTPKYEIKALPLFERFVRSTQ